MTVAYVVELTIEEGKQDAFKQKAAKYIEQVEAGEPGTLAYQWFLAEDGSRCLLYENFADSNALLAHLANVGPSLPDLLAIAPITRFEVLGEASADARAALADFGTVHFPSIGGFDRQQLAAV